MQRSWLAFSAAAIAAILLFGAGYWAGRPSGPPPFRSFRGEIQGTPLSGVSAEVREVLLEPDMLARTAELAALLGRLGPESLDDVKRAYDTVALDLGEIDLIVLAEWWARFDPDAAYEWTSSDWRAGHLSVSTRVFQAWGRENPSEAMVRAFAVFGQTGRYHSILAVLAGWDESGRPGLVDFVETQLAGQNRQRALYLVARRKISQEGAENTFRWAEALPDSEDEFKLNVFQRVAAVAAEAEPEAASAWAKKHHDGPYGRGLAQRVGTRWAKRDPEAAMRWLSTLPPGKGRAGAIEETYRTWQTRDRPAATAWIRSVELEPWMDPAVAQYAKSISDEQPEEALDWAARITDDQLRTGTQTVVARWWLVSDPEPAQAYLDALDRDAYSEMFWQKVYEIPPGLHPRVRQFKKSQKESKGS